MSEQEARFRAEALACYLEALGDIIKVAGNNELEHPQDGTLGSIGVLQVELCRELQHCHEEMLRQSAGAKRSEPQAATP